MTKKLSDNYREMAESSQVLSLSQNAHCSSLAIFGSFLLALTWCVTKIP